MTNCILEFFLLQFSQIKTMKNKNWSLVIGHLPAGRQGWSLRRQGFSLVELIFAVIMLTVIVFGVIKLQTSNLTLSNTQNNELQAHFLANEAIEIVEALGYDHINGKTCNDISTCQVKMASPSIYIVAAGTETISDIFTRRIELNTGPDLPSAYKTTAIVEWMDSAGDHSVSIKRIIF